MDDVAYASVPRENLPDSPAALTALLLGAAVSESCRVEGDAVVIEVDGASFALTLVFDEEDPGPGIDIAADEGEGDVVAGLISLGEVLETILPGAEVSTAWDE